MRRAANRAEAEAIFERTLADLENIRDDTVRELSAAYFPEAVGVPCPSCGRGLVVALQVKGRPVNLVDGPVVATVTIRAVECEACGFSEEYDDVGEAAARRRGR